MSNAQNLDRTGIFKVIPQSWQVRRKETGSVAISFRFLVIAELTSSSEWHDWTQYGEFQVYGDYYVIGKNGQVNQKTVEQLSASIGWRGTLGEIAKAPPPKVVVQVKVEENTFNGKTTYRAGWMNPGDYVPTMGGEDAETISTLDAQFGSLLRAAANSTQRPTGKPPAPSPKTPPKVDESQAATIFDDVKEPIPKDANTPF